MDQTFINAVKSTNGIWFFKDLGKGSQMLTKSYTSIIIQNPWKRLTRKLKKYYLLWKSSSIAISVSGLSLTVWDWKPEQELSSNAPKFEVNQYDVPVVKSRSVCRPIFSQNLSDTFLRVKKRNTLRQKKKTADWDRKNCFFSHEYISIT